MESFSVPKVQLNTKLSVNVPSSKSMANRALILSALSKGDFTIFGDFEAEDIQLMISGLHQMGVQVSLVDAGVKFQNDMNWMKSADPLVLNLGNSGTSLRFLTSLSCLRAGDTLLTGIQRMKERPLADLIDALGQLGFNVQYSDKIGFPPVEVLGTDHGTSQTYAGGAVRMRGNTSSQFVSSLLLIGSAFGQGLAIQVYGELISRPYVETTLKMIEEWGGSVSRKLGVRSLELRVEHAELKGHDYQVEGDASAAVYWWAIGFLHDVDVDVENVPLDSVQGDVGFLKLLQQMRDHHEGVFEVDMNDMPDASLMLMAMAPLMSYPIRITNIASLRVKETDRIDAMATELRRLGVDVQTGQDWMTVMPLKSFNVSPVEIETYNDHRIAMSFAISGTRIGNIVIKNPDCVQKTYPRFWDDLKRLTA